MEFFTKTKAVKLRSHLDKYLLADDDRLTVRQTRNSASSRRATWLVEFLPDKNDVVRLRSCFGTYLTASNSPFLLGATGRKVTQTSPGGEKNSDEWRPVRDGFQVRLVSSCGKYLRGNGGTPRGGSRMDQDTGPFHIYWARSKKSLGQSTYTYKNIHSFVALDPRVGWAVARETPPPDPPLGTPPWRNSVTHDEPTAGATKKWILWDVEAAIAGETESVAEYLSSVSNVSSISDELLEAVSDDFSGSDLGSPMYAVPPAVRRTSRLTLVRSFSPKLAESPNKKTNSTGSFNQFRSAMDFFHKAKVVRLRSHHDKYLHADEDEESVLQDRIGSSKNAKWTVETVPGSESLIRLKSCYSKYLTASNHPFLLGMTGRKVLQTSPRRLDSSVEWEPVREGAQIKLRTRYGNFLRANGGLPPWRNSVTHDIPHRTATQDWVLWDIDVVEIQVLSPAAKASAPPLPHADSLNFEKSESESGSPSSASGKPGNVSRLESNGGSPPKREGRTIYYHVAEDSWVDDDDDVSEGYSMNFKGNGVEGLTEKLKEETGLEEDIIVCSKSPLNGKLYPLRLQLPPNNSDMHVVVVPSSSKVAKEFSKQGLL